MGDYMCQQCSSVRCQQPISTRCVGVAHEMHLHSPVLVFSFNPISIQNSVFTDTGNLTPETHEQIWTATNHV